MQNDRKRCLAQFRTLKGTKRKSATSPAASTSKQPKVKREHDDPLGDEDFGDFIDEDDASDDDDGDDVSLSNGIGHFFSGSRVDLSIIDYSSLVSELSYIGNCHM